VKRGTAAVSRESESLVIRNDSGCELLRGTGAETSVGFERRSCPPFDRTGNFLFV